MQYALYLLGQGLLLSMRDKSAKKQRKCGKTVQLPGVPKAAAPMSL